MQNFISISQKLRSTIIDWEPKLRSLSNDIITNKNIAPDKIENTWILHSTYGDLSLKDMAEDFTGHFSLHLEKIDKLLENIYVKLQLIIYTYC